MPNPEEFNPVVNPESVNKSTVVALIRFAKSSLSLISDIPTTSCTITLVPGAPVELIPCSEPVVVTLAVEAFVIAEIGITLPTN